MGISQIFSSNAVKAVTNFVKAHPIATAAGVGTVGLIAYKAATSTPKENKDVMNRMILTNPIYNPMGYMYHTLHPTDNTLNLLDNPMLVNLNNSRFDCCA